jgi:hypothetical protein
LPARDTLGTTAEQALNMVQVVIFYDDIEGSEQLADYLNNHLPSSLREKGIVRHYHSEMLD